MVRSRVILGGLTLGGLLAAVLALAGVVHVRVIDEVRPVASPAPAPEPHTATQPELDDALLAADDLPGGYRATRAPAAPTTERGDATRGCRALFERPWELGQATDQALADYTGLRDGALLRQALTLFDPAGAERAFAQLRAASQVCRAFEARLEDGTAVRVHLRELVLQEVGDEVYAVRMTARGERGTQHGYLAVGRVGPLLSVLRHLGEEAVDPELVAATLRRALDRARVIPDALGRSEVLGAGKMEACGPCVSRSLR